MPRTTAFIVSSALLVLPGCSGLAKFDYRNLFSRDGWQRPDRVIEALGLGPGDRVADLGAGEGYFAFKFADAVGPEGRVYAVDVDPDALAKLRARAEADGYSNLIVVEAALDDPRLPDGEIDVAFLCNAYHHFEERTAYFDRLRADLAADGRVAVVEPGPSLLWTLTGHGGHFTALSNMRSEMRDAHYRPAASFDFLPLQNLEVFEADTVDWSP